MTSFPPIATERFFIDASTGELCQRRFRMRVVSGPDQGLERVLDSGTVMVGTHPNNDVVLSDSTISRYHLELQVLRDGLKITDLGSTNGTLQSATHGYTRIGSITVVGQTRLRLGKNTELEIVPEGEMVRLDEFRGDRLGKLLGTSQAMRRLFALLERVAATDATVLLEGETGTGKEAIAETIHGLSARARGPLVVVDCGSIPKELIASELFGHVRGAYTGASSDKVGLIEAASGGTLFLDEIGELAVDLQPQLLRVLEKRQVRRVGDTRAIPVDIRVLAATHRNLRQMVKEGAFREDLYYRLAVIRADVPPLRERREDVPMLAAYFAKQLSQGDDVPLSPALIDELVRHDWPGNVRELRNVVERALSLGVTGLGGSGLRAPGTSGTAGGDDGTAGFTTDVPEVAELLEQPFKEAKNQLIESFERDYLTHLLDKHKGNISRAAAAAGIDRNYIHRLVKKYNIPISRG